MSFRVCAEEEVAVGKGELSPESNQVAPPSWTSSGLQDCEKVQFCSLCCPVWGVVL